MPLSVFGMAAWRERNRDKCREYQRTHYYGDAAKAQRAAARLQAQEREGLKDRVKALGLCRVSVVVTINGPTKADKATIAKRWRDKMKARAHAALGGCCKVCGISVPECLHVDHIDPVPRNKTDRRRSTSTFQEVVKHKHPCSEFQLLCANCHAIKTHFNGEYSGEYWEKSA